MDTPVAHFWGIKSASSMSVKAAHSSTESFRVKVFWKLFGRITASVDVLARRLQAEGIASGDLILHTCCAMILATLDSVIVPASILDAATVI